ncbi:MAG: NAD(P)/FAD-dependent oxidoreductase, partial [Limisphaerales bacterium]
HLAREWKHWLCGMENSQLHQRLAGAQFDESSFCSVAGLSLRANRATDLGECAVGDAISMIPPLTGNGMSMAFESAAIAADPIAEFSRGTRTWEETRRVIATRCDEAFKTRLSWSGWLQHCLMHPSLTNWVIQAGAKSEKLWNLLFLKTR